ncbi:dihydrofolate reductase [Deinococcus sp. PESE-13]
MPSRQDIVAIAAQTENRVIGRDGGMPWHLPADFAHFRALSVGKPNIMGRKVFDTLRRKPLPERVNIVLTHNENLKFDGCLIAHSPEEALQLAGDAPEIAIIGGEEIYRLYWDRLTRLEMTLIHAELDGDTFFPEIGPEWELAQETFRPADEKNRYDLTFQTWRRRGSGQP